MLETKINVVFLLLKKSIIRFCIVPILELTFVGDDSPQTPKVPRHTSSFLFSYTHSVKPFP